MVETTIDPPPQLTERTLPTIPADGKDAAQLAGTGCASCRKRWPRPQFLVGRFPGGGHAFCCPDCVEATP